jgi:mannose-6-phosphate isomerase
MRELYPLLLRPQFHERVWGTRDLSPIYAREITGAPVGEAWLTGDACQVENGPLAGRTLAELSREFGSELLGDAAGPAQRFPLLIKFLFPRDKLSVQVHPDDETAALTGELCGKTECWYVLQAAPGALIALGLKPGTNKAEVERAIRETRLEKLLNWINVCPGDMFYVEAGTIHAIGPGSVIVETQQNSDTTYRLYDYGRPRELHVEAGLRAAKERTRAGRVPAAPTENVNGKRQTNLVTSPCFVVDKFHLARPWQFQRARHARTSPWCLVALRGYGALECNGSGVLSLSAGEAVVVPAAVEKFILKPQWELEFLCSSLPVEPVAPPTTVLDRKERESVDKNQTEEVHRPNTFSR